MSGLKLRQLPGSGSGSAPASQEPIEAWELPPPAYSGRVVTARMEVDADGNECTPSWPDNPGNVCCWHCCHPFEGQPIPLPTAYDSRRDAFRVMGVFCSWSCAKAYNRDNMRQHTSTSHLLTLLRKRATGVLAHTTPAPPRQTLTMFGGPLTIDEFRQRGPNNVCTRFVPVRMVFATQSVREDGPSYSSQVVSSDASLPLKPPAISAHEAIFVDGDVAPSPATAAAALTIKRGKGRPRKTAAPITSSVASHSPAPPAANGGPDAGCERDCTRDCTRDGSDGQAHAHAVDGGADTEAGSPVMTMAANVAADGAARAASARWRTRSWEAQENAAAVELASRPIVPEQLRLKKKSFLPMQGSLEMFLKK